MGKTEKIILTLLCCKKVYSVNFMRFRAKRANYLISKIFDLMFLINNYISNVIYCNWNRRIPNSINIVVFMLIFSFR